MSATLRAFDELRFGRTRTLDLRRTLPTAAQAQERAEGWLRERQASVGGDVLIITGRGRGSEGGLAVVRPAVQRRISRLIRQGVVASVREHTPGSFVVSLAPLRALLEASRRKKDPPLRTPKVPVSLAALDPATQSALRELAVCSLDLLGAPRIDALIEHEMLNQFTRLAGFITGPDRDARLRAAVLQALAETTDA